MHRFQKWRDALQVAPNVDKVAGIMEDYVSAIAASASALPQDCQEILACRPLDIQEAAVTLLHAELDFRGSHEASDFLHEVAHTFAAASVRMTLLHGTYEPAR